MKKHLFILPIFITITLMLSTAALAQKRTSALPSWQEQLDKKYTTGLFRSVDGTYFDLRNDNTTDGYFNVLDWLQGRVAGLQVYTYRNNRVPLLRNRPAAVYINEMRVDAGFLNMLPVQDIAMIKVIKTPFLGGLASGDGAIVIYTKEGEEEEEIVE
jgi:hypothetical protein